MKKKLKSLKIKKQRPLSTIGFWSILLGVAILLLTALIFIVAVFLDDPIINTIMDMNEGLRLLLFIFLVFAVILWFILKLFMAFLSLLGFLLPAILFIVSGLLVRNASENYNNIFSNRANRVKACVSIGLWIISGAVVGMFIYLFSKSKIEILNNETVKPIILPALIVILSLSIVFALIVFIDFMVKKRKFKYDENGKIVDETIVSSDVLKSENKNVKFIENKQENELKNQDNSSFESQEKKYKIGDETENGVVIGFNVNTGEPIFMPKDN